MKKYLVFLFLPVFLQAQQSQVLFLGNSYTYTNNMPDLLKQLALSAGDSINWDSNTPGGYTFQNHTQDANSLAKINLRQWNFVILQGQSQEPSLDTAYVDTAVFPYAHQLDSLVHANDSCTQTIFFMTWGRKNGDAQNCPTYPPVCTFAGMEQQLRGRYLQMANDNGAIVAPVGEAWKNVIATNPSFDLYMVDESHPSLYGSYLTACVFYASIFRQSPFGLPYYGGLQASEATFLQNIAGHTVLDSLNLWNTEIYHPDANFSFTTSTQNFTTVTNTDPNAISWSWNDGTGNDYVNGSANEILYYTNGGIYNVCLAVSNGCLTDTFCQTIPVGPAGINSPSSPEYFIHSIGGEINIHFSSAEKRNVKIFDVQGNLIRDAEATSSEESFENLRTGIFLVVIDSGISHTTNRIFVLSN